MSAPIDLIPEEPTLADSAQSGPAAETEAAKVAQHFHDLAHIGGEQAQAHQAYAEKKASLPQIHQDPEPDVPMSHKEELKPAPKLLASHPEQALPNGHTRESLEALYTSDPLKYHELMAQFLHEKAQLWTEGPDGYREIARKFEAERGPIGTHAPPKAVEGVDRGIASVRAPHPTESAGPTAPTPVRGGVENTPPSPKKSPDHYRGVEAVGNVLKEGGNPPKGGESPKGGHPKVLDLSRRSPMVERDKVAPPKPQSAQVPLPEYVRAPAPGTGPKTKEEALQKMAERDKPKPKPAPYKSVLDTATKASQVSGGASKAAGKLSPPTADEAAAKLQNAGLVPKPPKNKEEAVQAPPPSLPAPKPKPASQVSGGAGKATKVVLGPATALHRYLQERARQPK